VSDRSRSMRFVIQVAPGKAKEVACSGASTGADDNAARGQLGANRAAMDLSDTPQVPLHGRDLHIGL
jgi:hypothetical protein